MDKQSKPEKLDVSEEGHRLRLERQLIVVQGAAAPPSGPPNIVPVGRSKILDRAKLFLPALAAAEADLTERMQSGENVDIEHCTGSLE